MPRPEDGAGCVSDSGPRLAAIARRFRLAGRFVEARALASGHIHDTYRVTCDRRGVRARYLFQQINRRVFEDPVAVTRNVALVTAHIRRRLEHEGCADIGRRCLRLVQTDEGGSVVCDDRGEFWRAYDLIEGARTFDVVRSKSQAYAAARAFGDFLRELASLELDRLIETIPGFHDTPARYAVFESVVDADPCGRRAEAAPEIEFARAHRGVSPILRTLEQRGAIPLRAVHNDTKLNNILFDAVTGEALCVIDLDTVMPGLSLYDFGDLVRTAASSAPEDEPDPTRVELQLPLFEALVEGYLAGAGTALTPTEIDHLAFAGELIAFETGLRFLTDYLAGDSYFRIHRERHNLERCRAQFKLVVSMQRQADAMREVVRKTRPG